MVREALKAADNLAKDGINAEIVDLRTIAPLDVDTIIASVKKTHKAVVVQEAQRMAGVAANVISEICLLYTSPSPRDSTSSRMPSSA